MTNHRAKLLPKKIFILLLLFKVTVAGLSGQPAGIDSITAKFYLQRAGILYEMSDYDSLPFYYREALGYYRQSGDSSNEIQCLIGLAEYYRIISDYEDALFYLEEAEGLLGENIPGYTEALADLIYTEGKILSGLGKYREALKQIQLAMETQGPENRQMSARYLNYTGKVYSFLGNLDSAEIFYRKSFELINSVTDEPAIEKAWYYLNMSQIYKERGEYDKVLESLFKNIQLYLQIYDENFQELSSSYLNLANFYILTGSLDSASYYLDLAEVSLKKDSISVIYLYPILYTYRGSMDYIEGNWMEAKNNYYQALQAEIELYGPRHPYTVTYYNNYANGLKVTGDYENALEYYQRSLQSSRELHPSQVMKTYYYLASTYSMTGQTEEAEYWYNRLIKDRTRFYGSDHLLLSYDYISYGDFLTRIGNSEASSKYFTRALEIRNNSLGEQHYLTAEAYRYNGRYHAGAGDYLEALEYYQKALISVSDQPELTDYNSNPDISENINLLYLLQILKDKGLALENLNNDSKQDSLHTEYLRASYESFRLAAEVIYRMHNEWLTEESRLYLADNERETLLSLIRVSLELFEQTGNESYITTAFETAENMKYSTLLAILRDQRALEMGDVPEGLQNLDRQLRNQLAAYKSLVAQERFKAEPDSVKFMNWNKKINEISGQRRGLIRQLSKRYPDYYSIKYHSGILSDRSVRNNLRDDEIILEYVLTDTILITFILDKDRISCDRIVIGESFFRDIETVYDFITTDYFNTTAQGISDYFGAASALYEILIGRHNIPDNRNLIIVPDGLLAYLPYEILLNKPVDEKVYDFGELPYLIRTNPLSYAYSASLVYHSDFSKIRARKGLLAFAPSDPASMDPDSLIIRDTPIDRNKLQPLIGSEKEVKAIISIIGGDLKIGEQASEYSFKELASKYRILHLAMHTFIDDEDPLYSKLVFSPSTDGDQDGFLNVFEIYNLKLNASMVVLSACNTGTGLIRKGEGIMSLARAFFYAGIPDVIMTLWTVGDESGGKLMTDFYQGLAKGDSKDVALRNAKLSFLNEADPITRHPYYWSGYIIVGDQSPVFVSRTRKYMIIGGIMILVILGFLYKNRLLKRGKEKKGLQAF